MCQDRHYFRTWISAYRFSSHQGFEHLEDFIGVIDIGYLVLVLLVDEK